MYPIRHPPIKLSGPKEKRANHTPKAKEKPNQAHGIMNGLQGTRGLYLLRAKAEAKAKTLLVGTASRYGATSTSVMVTQPTGVMTILTALEENLFPMTLYGVNRVIDPDTPPLCAMQPP